MSSFAPYLGKDDPCFEEADSFLGGAGSCLEDVDPCLGEIDPCLGEVDPCLGGADPCLGGADPLIVAVVPFEPFANNKGSCNTLSFQIQEASSASRN